MRLTDSETHMATVRIGELDLDVKRATLGFLKKKLTPARKVLSAAGEDDMPDALAGLVHCYVGHNEGVTADWLLEALPADPSAIIRELIVASGQKVAEPKPGEAARQ